MPKKIRSLVCLAACAAAMMPACLLHAAENSVPQEPALIAVLKSDSPAAEKAITCKRLAVYGSKEAVPALAALLPDAELSSWARIALEAIPGPEADGALRDAVGKVAGRMRVGIINSIATRRDAGAVEILTGQLKDADAEVASAAAVALGRIGNEAATRTLQQSLADAPAPVKSAMAEGCILCAEQLLAEGKKAEAAGLYELVRKADVPKQRIIEATRGAILAKEAAGLPLLVEQLQSKDKAFFALGLGLAREIAGNDTTKAVIAEFEKAAPEKKASLLLVLADRADVAALPAVLAAAKSGSKDSRIAAIEVVERLGNASCLPALLEIAVESDEGIAEKSREAMEKLPGKEVDGDLAARLQGSKGAAKRVLIQVIGKRRIDAVPALIAAADDADAQTRAAALTALGSVVGLDKLSVLTTRASSAKNPEDLAAARKALREACVRMPDREACAQQLVDAMGRAPVEAKCEMLKILALMGGPKALQAIGAAAKAQDADLQDTATQLLGEWMAVDAAPVLLDLAKANTKYEVRAVRAYIRLVRQFTLPEDQRIAMCRTALQIAKRDAEKKLVLEVLERYASLDGLRLAVEVAKTPSLKQDALASSLVIAQKVGGSPDVNALLAQLGQEPVKIEIVKAEYGAEGKSKDVTEVLRKQVRDLPLIVLPSASYNKSFTGDPAPGVAKKLKIQYRINGKAGEVSLAEDAMILLPMPK